MPDTRLERIDCCLCDVDDAAPFAEENGYLAVQCRRCGLVYLRERPTIAAMKQLYQGQETKIDLRSHMRDRDWRQAAARRSLEMLRRYRKTGRVLEVGSAAGWFLAEAKRAGFTVQGIDITRQLCEFANDVLGVPTFEGILRDAPFPPGSFDVVYMRNVLSHLSDPIAEHRILHRLLAPGGLLLFETGNVAELPAAEAGTLELPDHLFHFSEATIRRLLERTDFRWIATHRYVVLHDHALVRAAKRLLPRRRARSPSRREEPAALDALPPSRPWARAVGELRQIIRYDLGARLPASGQRCTLVVAAERA
jgi:SAM-dependent methyltransferase